jgi:hypothetical protein
MTNPTTTAPTEAGGDRVDGGDIDRTMTDSNADNGVNGEETSSAATPFSEHLSIETATADVQSALDDYPDTYPFNHHFHPTVDQPILGFDPTVVQDDFDPFDLDDYLHLD